MFLVLEKFLVKQLGAKGWFPRIVAIIIVLFLAAGDLHSQPKNDSLIATFATLEDDSVRLDSMLKIVFKLGYADPMLGLWLCGQAEAEPASKEMGWVRARAHNLRGIIYFNLKINDLAMANLLEAARLADSLGLDRLKVNALNNLGTLQEEQGLFNEALQSYRRAREGYLKNGSMGNAVMALTNVALAYFDLKQYDRALEVCDSVLLEISDPNDALAHERVYGLMGEIYNGKKDYAKALEMLDRSVKLAGEAGDDYGKAEDLITRATVKVSMDLDESALKDLGVALEMVRGLGVSPFAVDCYDLYAKIAKKQGNMLLAVDWMERSKALADSIHAEENRTALANYQALYEVKEKDAQIDLLNKDKELQAANLASVWYLLGLVVVALLAMLVILILLMRSMRTRTRINSELADKNSQILQQNEQISRQIATLRNQNEELNSLNLEMQGLMNVVAHDLKAPLNQLGGLISVVEEEGNLNVRQQKMLSLANKVTLNAANLVKDLVEFGSIGPEAVQADKVELEMKAFVSDMAATFAAEAARKSISLETWLPDSEIICLTASDQLGRVLENLVSNAIKFSPMGRTVSIGLVARDHSLEISVKDQGPGISPADQKHLYRKFHKLTARPTGGESSTGLGLAIVKSLVEKLGGTIHLQSEIGMGSTFTVTLPLK